MNFAAERANRREAAGADGMGYREGGRFSKQKELEESTGFQNAY